MATGSSGSVGQTPAASGNKQGTVRELLTFVYPSLSSSAGSCPPWPPDAFAIVATLMRRNGAYVRAVPTGFSEGATATSLLGAGWADRARQVGEEWHEAVCQALRAQAGSASFRSALQSVVIPQAVSDAWSALLLGADLPLERSRADDDLSRAALQLCAYADEASEALGMPWFGQSRTEFRAAASFFLERNEKLSFCCSVDPQKTRVLAKKHTPQQGLTLRSLTNHLSLCMPWEVEAQWYEFDAPRIDDVLNLLLLPWPLEVEARQFRLLENPGSAEDYPGYRTFTFSRAPIPAAVIREKFESALDNAKQRVSSIHAVVLPELALTREEWDVAEQVAVERRVLLISGIMDDVEEVSSLPMNSCRIQLASLTPPERSPSAAAPRNSAAESPASGQPTPQSLPPSGASTTPSPPVSSSGSMLPSRSPAYRQAKHHRWCLDRPQVLQYDLGGQIPSSLRSWENSQIGRRGIFFATLGGWLTFSVLVCEDLARQEPIAEVLRSVGPNLVIALLMDGPQLSSRWPARYASVLADDPGSSVLTLTSLGMCVRSRSASKPSQPPSRVIALWKDKLYGVQEIALDADSTSCVLSLSCEAREEFTADGRSDGGSTEVPVFSGVYQLP